MIPRDLLSGFDPNHPRGVVAFVGSGPSIAAGLPNWPELLRLVARDVGVEADVRDALQGGRFLDVAQYLAYRKGEQAIRVRVSEVLRDYSAEPHPLHEAIVGVPLRGIITTNYDLLLTRADSARHFDTPITHSTSNLTGHLTRRFVFHLHGHVDDPSTLVLTRGSYDSFALGQADQAKAFLQGVFQSHIVLFVGFGFRDENVDSALRDFQHAGITTGWNTFAVLPEGPGFDPVRHETLQHRGIAPVYLDADTTDSHAQDASLLWLQQLGAAAKQLGSSVASPASALLPSSVIDRLNRLLAQREIHPPLASALRKLPNRPDLQHELDTLSAATAAAILSRLDRNETRIVLIHLNEAAPDAVIRDALSCLPPTN